MVQMEAYKVLTANRLKIIAATAMFFDHFVSVFIPHNELLNLVFRLLGRTAAPIFCFFVAQGFHYTSNVKKYTVRLLILAVISHFPYNLSFGLTSFQRIIQFLEMGEFLAIAREVFRATSVIWPLAMGLLALTAFKSEKINLIMKLAITAACCVLSFRANWNFVAVLWILAFGIFHGNFKRQIAAFCIISVVFHLIPAFIRYGFFHPRFPQWFQLGIFLTIPLLAMFNGKAGNKSRFMTWFFYVFYPGHLIFLYLLNQFTSLAEMLGR